MSELQKAPLRREIHQKYQQMSISEVLETVKERLQPRLPHWRSTHRGWRVDRHTDRPSRVRWDHMNKILYKLPEWIENSCPACVCILCWVAFCVWELRADLRPGLVLPSWELHWFVVGKQTAGCYRWINKACIPPSMPVYEADIAVWEVVTPLSLGNTINPIFWVAHLLLIGQKLIIYTKVVSTTQGPFYPSMPIKMPCFIG